MTLITLNDVRSVRKISKSFDSERFEAFAISAQDENLRMWLGDALYLDLIDNSETLKYQTLLNGENYLKDGEMIKFFGIKKYLAYIWLSIFAIEGDEFQADIGTVNFNQTQPTHNMPKSKKVTADKYQSSAIIYKNNTIDYLDVKKATYPLWEGGRKDSRSKMKFMSI